MFSVFIFNKDPINLINSSLSHVLLTLAGYWVDLSFYTKIIIRTIIITNDFHLATEIICVV